MKVQLADRIRKARRKAGLSQSKAAEGLGVHRGTFGHWERGAGHVPTSANLMQLAMAMAVSYEWLATGRGPMQLSSIEDEVPALRLDCFAQSDDEELLLLAFRKSPAHRRKAIVDFARSDASHAPASQEARDRSPPPPDKSKWRIAVPVHMRFGQRRVTPLTG